MPHQPRRSPHHDRRQHRPTTLVPKLRRQRDEDREREQEALAELRRRAEVAEAELDAARLRLAEVDVPAVVVVAGPEAMETPHTAETPSTSPMGVQGLWRRLRRVWRGA